MNYIRWFEQLNISDVTLAGGKATRLSEIAKIGFNVPQGFCIITTAYKRFIDFNHLDSRIFSDLHAVDFKSSNGFSSKAKKIQSLILASQLPFDITEEITIAYRSLCNQLKTQFVVVRSAATTEDLDESSFAGQYNSYLNISNIEGLLESVKKCWASLWNPQALSYRLRNNVDQQKAYMSVIVQQMIPSEVSGVMFTVNPTNGAKDEIVITSNWGLGDSIVGGFINPDYFVVHKKGLKIIHKKIAEKDRMIINSTFTDGTEEVEVPKQRKTIPSLNKKQIRALARVGRKMENHFDSAQDIEWAFHANKLYILQSRPITSISEANSTAQWHCPEYPKDYWSRQFVYEWFRAPLSPLFVSLQLPVLMTCLQTLLCRRLGVCIKLPVSCIINGYLYIRGNISFSLRLVLFPYYFWKDLNYIDKFWREKIVPEHLTKIAALKPFDIRSATSEAILEHINQVCKTNGEYFAWNIYTGIFCILTELIFAKYYKKLFNQSTSIEYTKLLEGIESKSAEADQELHKLAHLAENIDAIKTVFLEKDVEEVIPYLEKFSEGNEFLNQFYNFQENYGHQIFDLDIIEPTLQEEPTKILSLIKSYISQEIGFEKMRDQKNQQKNIIESTRQKIKNKPLRLILFDKIFGITRRYASIRENRPFYLHMGWPILRKSLLELGARFESSDLISFREDIFFLTNDELIDIVYGRHSKGLKQLIIERKELWQSQKQLNPPDAINPTFIGKIINAYQYTGKHGKLLKGFAGSAGKVTAPARLILSPTDFNKLKKGEVLVAPATTPAWTLLFSLASALVTDIGGPLSHGAIVAREYGIPSVIGAKNATKVIRDEQKITVNGDEGIVILGAKMGSATIYDVVN